MSAASQPDPGNHLPTDSTLDLVARLYQAAMEPARWPHAMAALCAPFAAAQAALLIADDSGTGTMRVAAIGPSGATTEPAAWQRLWQDHASHSQAPVPALAIATRLHLPGARGAAIVLRRTEAAPPFHPASHAQLADIARQTEAALRLRRQLAASAFGAAVRAATLDHLPQGVLALTPDAVVAYANDAAASWLNARGATVGVGLPLLLQLPSLQARLHTLVRAAADGRAAGSLRLPAQPGLAPLALSVARLPISRPDGKAAHEDAFALVTLRQMGATTSAPPQRAMDLFGLTPAEAAVLHLLLAGHGAHAIARERQVTASTVRTQIRGILSKTGTHNMRTLTALMLSLGPD